METIEITKEEVSEDIGSNNDSKLIVFNDEVNTFNHVIISLVHICKHTVEQAEQCAMIIHNSGKYPVKSGSKEEMESMKEALDSRGITCEIQ